MANISEKRYNFSMNTQYTEDQISDIRSRMDKGTESLKELGLEVAVQIIPYLKDTKFDQPNQTVEPVPENPAENA